MGGFVIDFFILAIARELIIGLLAQKCRVRVKVRTMVIQEFVYEIWDIYDIVFINPHIILNSRERNTMLIA